MVGNYPVAMTAKDKWGEVLIVYLLISWAPTEVVHYFMEMHWRTWGMMPFDVIKIIRNLTICKSCKCLKPYFPCVDIDWGSILKVLIRSNVPLCMFWDLAEASISSCSNCMSVDDLIEINQDVLFLEWDLESAEADDVLLMYKMIQARVIAFMQLKHCLLTNVATNLELVLWRVVLTKEPLLINDPEDKMRIRANCGNVFQVVIPIVLLFL